VWLDGTFVKVRDNGRVVSQAMVVAIGVTATGEREVLGFDSTLATIEINARASSDTPLKRYS